MRVRVERHNNLALRLTQTKVKRHSFAGIRFREEPHQRFVAELFAHDFAGAILRAVIDDNDLEIVVIGIEQAANRGLDDELFVIRRHDDRHERLELFTGMFAFAAA